MLFLFLASYSFTFSQKPLSYLPTEVTNDHLIADLLTIKQDEFKTILSNPKKFEIQIIYTQVNHQANGKIELVQHQFQLNPNQYFYPASLVKLQLKKFNFDIGLMINLHV